MGRVVQVAVGMMLGLGLAAVAGLQPARAAGGWRLVQWGGIRVGSVTVNQQIPTEVAAVADGTLELSHDSGASWAPCSLPSAVSAVAYDPVQAGDLYVGTNSGMYLSSDDGLHWRLLESVLTARKIVVAVTVADHYIFASMYDGAGTPVQVFRFTPDGSFVDTRFPAGNAAAFSYDAGRHRLYAGADGGVYSSDDDGASWQGGGRGAGSFTTRVIVKPDAVWQLSADGLFRSSDAGQSWDKLAGPADINGTYYGNGMHLSGLAVSNGAAYYGAWSTSFPYQFLVDYSDGSAHSILDARVNDVAADSSQLWAATDNGLWVNSGLVSSEASIKRPVIIVPGILGSLPTSEALKNYAAAVVDEGYWGHSYKTPLELDPIDHTYDGLLNYLQARGYRRDQNLFVFPYNWMQDNSTTAKQLAQKISDVRQVCGCPQVDIVAHSMGGLLARSYIQSDAYQNDIATLIQLATPNAGAVEDYAVWESGEYSGITTPSSLFNSILHALAQSQTDIAKVAAVHALLPSVGQLLPVFDYLDSRQYPVDYPRNTFLDALNQPADITRLKQRVALYVVGAATKPTLESLTVGPAHQNGIVWPDGAITASKFGAGDSTVLQSSLEAVAKASLLLNTDHGGIVTAAAPFIAQTLMGGYGPDPDPAASLPPDPTPSAYLAVYASGPVTLRLTAPGGQEVDDTALGIPGAYYSGSMTTPQLMMVPQSPDSYQLTATATSSGAYVIGAQGASAASPSEVGGIAMTGQSWQYRYDSLTQTLEADNPVLSGTTGPVTPYPPATTPILQPPLGSQSQALYPLLSFESPPARPASFLASGMAVSSSPSVAPEDRSREGRGTQRPRPRSTNSRGVPSWWEWVLLIAALVPLVAVGLVLLC